jgi:hypothetical protein
MDDQLDQFKRANFFPGLQVGPAYWNGIEDYHVRKEWLYNKLFHGAGVVPGFMGSLQAQVEKTKAGLITLLIDPGIAVDGLGRPLFLYKPATLVLDLKKFKLPCTVYVIIKYEERLEDYYQNRDNAELQGYQKRLETVTLDIVPEIRDPAYEIELARIRLEEDEGGGIREIKDISRYTDPGKNILDYRFVPWVNQAKIGISPQLHKLLEDIGEYTRKVASSGFEVLPLPSLQNLYNYAIAAAMQVRCNPLAFEDVIHLTAPFFDLDYQALFGIAEYERNNVERKFLYTTKDTYKAAWRAIHNLGDRIESYHKARKPEDWAKNNRYRGNGEEIEGILREHRTVMENLWQTLAPAVKRISFADIKNISMELPHILYIGEDRYTQVDTIDLASQISMDSHNFMLVDTSHTTTSHEVFTYPDSQPVHDTVKRWVEGGMRFHLQNIIRGKKTLIIRRTDMYHGNYQVDVLVEGAKPRVLEVNEVDVAYRWRNLLVSFDEGELTGNADVITFNIRDKGRDNSGTIWIYQML